MASDITPEALGFLTAVGVFVVVLAVLFLFITRKLCFSRVGGLPCLEPSGPGRTGSLVLRRGLVNSYGNVEEDFYGEEGSSGSDGEEEVLKKFEISASRSHSVRRGGGASHRAAARALSRPPAGRRRGSAHLLSDQDEASSEQSDCGDMEDPSSPGSQQVLESHERPPSSRAETPRSRTGTGTGTLMEPSLLGDPAPTRTSTPSPAPTRTSTPTSTHTRTPNPTPTPSHISTRTPNPTPTPSHISTRTPNPTPTPSHISTRTPNPTPTPSHISTRTPTPTPTPSHISTRTPNPTPTPSHISTRTPTPSHISTRTPTPTPSHISTRTPNPTPTPSHISTRTPTPTPSHISTRTPNPTPTPSLLDQPSPRGGDDEEEKVEKGRVEGVDNEATDSSSTWSPEGDQPPLEEVEATPSEVSSSSTATTGPPKTTTCGHLLLWLEYCPDAERLQVRVLGARDIPDKARSGSDCHQVHVVLLPAKRQRYKTSAQRGALPRFDEDAAFRFSRLDPSDLPMSALRFRLYALAGRMTRERLVGESILTLGGLNAEGGAMETSLLLEPRSNLKSLDAPASPVGLAPGEGALSSQTLAHGGIPELLVGLSYKATTGRMSVEILKGSHFRNLAVTRPPDTYCRLVLLNSVGQEISRCKTSVRRGQPNPVFKETFVFQVALFQLSDVTLMVSIYSRRSMKRKEMVGWVSLGQNSSGDEELLHWQDMKDGQGQWVCRWHMLLDA